MVEAHSTVRRAACPRCSTISSRLHGHYRCVVADSPCFGGSATLAVEVRRFKCINDCCAQRTFCECIEPLAVASQRRTLRLIGRAGAWLRAWWPSGRSAGRADEHAGRGSTVLRELRRADCLPTPDPVVVGIDDWALARCHRYGTIVVDLDRHCPIELLAGRDAPTVVSWLKGMRSGNPSSLVPMKLRTSYFGNQRTRRGGYGSTANTVVPGAGGGVSSLWSEGQGVV